MNNSIERLQKIQSAVVPCAFCGHPRHLHRNNYGRCLCKAFTGPSYSSASWNPDCGCARFLAKEEYPLMSLDPTTNKLTILNLGFPIYPDQERLTIL